MYEVQDVSRSRTRTPSPWRVWGSNSPSWTAWPTPKPQWPRRMASRLNVAEQRPPPGTGEKCNMFDEAPPPNPLSQPAAHTSRTMRAGASERRKYARCTQCTVSYNAIIGLEPKRPRSHIHIIVARSARHDSCEARRLLRPETTLFMNSALGRTSEVRTVCPTVPRGGQLCANLPRANIKKEARKLVGADRRSPSAQA